MHFCSPLRRLGLVAIVIASAPALAQAPPWGYAPDTNQVTVVGDRVAQTGEISQAYTYVMVYDSICHVEYMVTECRRNSILLRLLHWNEGNSYHAPAPYLTFNSRTANFPIMTGDTVSFYRELEWYEPLSRYQGTANYYSPDTLEWIAHLVRTSDGAPMAIIDSTGILPNTSIGAPRIYGSRPIMAIARYVIPPGVTDSAFIGFTVRANGSGTYHFVRVDSRTSRVSQRLTDAWYVQYLNRYSPGFAKRDVGEFTVAGDARYALDVAQTGRDVAISFSAPAGEQDGIAINIYDATGRLVYSPYAEPGKASQRGKALHRFDRAGRYFVALLSGSRIVRVEKVNIN